MATEEGEEKDSDWSLTGFLFGNINEKGELEDESILDEVTEHFYSSILANFLTKYFCLCSNIFGTPDVRRTDRLRQFYVVQASYSNTFFFCKQESRRHLSRLESLGGLGSLVKDISSLEEKSERSHVLDHVGGLLCFLLLFCTFFFFMW